MGAIIGILIMALSLHYYKEEKETIQARAKTIFKFYEFRRFPSLHKVTKKYLAYLKANRIKNEIEKFEKTLTRKEINATSTFKHTGPMSDTL